MAGDMNKLDALKIALSGSFVRRSLFVSAVVGTILNVINQGGAVMAGQGFEFVKGALTFSVPFCVSTYASWSTISERGIDNSANAASELNEPER